MWLYGLSDALIRPKLHTYSTIRPPRKYAPTPLGGRSYCTGFLSCTHAPPCGSPAVMYCMYMYSLACYLYHFSSTLSLSVLFPFSVHVLKATMIRLIVAVDYI